MKVLNESIIQNMPIETIPGGNQHKPNRKAYDSQSSGING